MSVEKESSLLYICLQRSHKCTPDMAIKPHMFYAPENQLSFVADVKMKVELSTFPKWENYFLVSLVQEVHIRGANVALVLNMMTKLLKEECLRFGGNTDPASLFTEI